MKKETRTKKILVTGALGHIGSRLIRELTGSYDEAILADNLATQRYPSLFNLPSGRAYRFFEEDITTTDLRKHLDGVDAVVHLAALTNAESSHGREKEFEEVNLKGLTLVADACLDRGVRLIFPSSTSVYGSQEKLVDETCAELKPQSPYALSKLSAEEYLRSLKSKGLKFVIFRFGTIFGSSIGMRFHTAVNKFTWQAVNGKPITVWKTAWKQRRPYLDLGDCVSAVNFALDSDLFDGEIYNVVTKNFTVEEIVETIRAFVPKLEINYVDSAIMNQLSYDVDGTKLSSRGFKPEGDIVKGIQSTVDYLKGIQV